MNLQKGFLTIFTIVILVFKLVAGEEGTISGRFEYFECENTVGIVACEVHYTFENSSDTILLRQGRLKDLNIKNRTFQTEELRYVYSSDGKKKVYFYEVERELYKDGKILSEQSKYLYPDSGYYQTTYKYSDEKIRLRLKLLGKSIPSFLPCSSVTKDMISGEVVGKTNYIDSNMNLKYCVLEETHLVNGEIVFKAKVQRDLGTGMIIREQVIKGKRKTDYHIWWPGYLFNWPVM